MIALVKPILALGCALAVFGATVCTAATARPNVILFLVDDLGYGDVAAHGNPHVKTPNADAFARAAVEFTQFHVSPVCSPTRASLMTGRYNFRTGVADVSGAASQMDAREVTVANVLHEAGYVTGLFGKWHLGDVRSGLQPRGFDESLTFQGGVLGGGYFNPKLFHNGVVESKPGYSMDIFTDAAIAFIRKNKAKPFFVYLPANLIHAPLQVPSELAAEFDLPELGASTQKIYGMIRSVDNNFGRLRAELRELGLEDNTLLIFTSDNGTATESHPTENRFMAGLHGAKGTVYEGGIRVPCFMRWPADFKASGKIANLAAHIDVMPTILEAAGVPVPAAVKLDGISLLPLLRSPAAPWPDRTLLFQWDSGQEPRRGLAFTVLTKQWKLVQPCGMDKPGQKHIRDTYAELCRVQGRGERSMDGPPRYELYDLAGDPGERNDVAAAHPDIIEKMKKQYAAWFDDVAARWAQK